MGCWGTFWQRMMAVGLWRRWRREFRIEGAGVVFEELELVRTSHCHGVALPVSLNFTEEKGLAEKFDEFASRNMFSVVGGMFESTFRP